MNRRTLLASLAGLIAAMPFVGKAQAEPDEEMIGLIYPRPGEWTETPRFDAATSSENVLYMNVETAQAWDEIMARYR